ncbi:MAG: GC-type dockerin domain-anchored protein, partial [Planctomycetota bacterium]
DTDGDGLLDQFAGGVIVTFANIDTDGDPNNGNEILDADTNGYYVLFAEELTAATAGGPLGVEDFGDLPNIDPDGDGNYEGTFELFVAGSEGPDTDGDGNGDSGDIFNQFFVSGNNAQIMIWGPNGNDTNACATSSVVNDISEAIIWGQGQTQCDPADPNGGGTGFSDGASDGGVVNNIWDPSIDVTDFSGLVACPDPTAWAVTIQGEGGATGPCADTNENGVVDPGDFNAWVIAFNAQSPLCDQNGDGLCDPSDFNAWVINFNSGAPCP